LPCTHRHRSAAGARGLALLIAVLCFSRAAGDAGLQFAIASLEGDGWRAEQLAVELRRDAAGRLSATISAARLAMPEPVGNFTGLAAECRRLRITARRFSCEIFEASGEATALPLDRFSGSLEYRRDTGALRWDLEARTHEGGRLSSSGELEDGAWRLRLTAVGLPAAELGRFGLGAESALELDGTLELNVVARGRATGPDGLAFAVGSRNLALANQEGTVAAESLAFEINGSVWPERDGLGFDARGELTSGEAYLEPVYADLGNHPLQFSARGHAANDQLELQAFTLDLDGVARASGSALLQRIAGQDWTIARARLQRIEASLPGAYAVLLQPFLAGTDLADLETSGSLQGELDLNDGRPDALRLELLEVNLDDRAGRLAIYGLGGELAWARAAEAATMPVLRPSRLHWSGGYLYGIPIGATALQMDARVGRWVLAKPISIPVLDGELQLDRLEIGDFSAGDDSLVFDARLTPLSMRELSLALDWPPMSGQLSGTLPSLSYTDGVLTFGGELRAEIFAGVVTVNELRVEQPLQPLAKLEAEIELRGLDLSEITEAFSFGLMTGRLDGHVRGLKMIDWAPVAFDARLYTPSGDRSRKRISQRAVDNIASIGGGGGAGALSTGFLRFFEDFAYDAFALGCRLEGDVCQMTGIEPQGQAYVILRGRGLPRIDVMGFATRVSWSTLVSQLASILESEGPEVR
jgi:hypothetical protein